MKLIRNLCPHKFPMGCVMSIGNFDGVHVGHQAIIKRVVARAKAKKIPAVVTTFEPHPHEFFSQKCNDRIMGLRDKFLTIKALAPDYLYVMRFNQHLASTNAESFVENILIDGFKIQSLIVGDDFRFGKLRQGDFDLLQSYAQRFDFELENTNTLLADDLRVSSTRIRSLLRESDFAQVKSLLGRDYFISGHVSHGDKLGRTLGFPTLNIRLSEQQMLVTGVFAVEVHGLGEKLKGVANMGYRPTLAGQAPRLEVHLFDFDRDCYGERIKVVFRHKIREEQKFINVQRLRSQIEIDVKQAQQLFLS